MRNDLESKLGSSVYNAVMNSNLSERDREVALSTLENAEALVEAFLWVTRKIERLGERLFLKPSLRH